MLHNYEYRYLSICVYIYIISGNCRRFFQPAMFVDLRVSWPNASHAQRVKLLAGRKVCHERICDGDQACRAFRS